MYPLAAMQPFWAHFLSAPAFNLLSLVCGLVSLFGAIWLLTVMRAVARLRTGTRLVALAYFCWGFLILAVLMIAEATFMSRNDMIVQVLASLNTVLFLKGAIEFEHAPALLARFSSEGSRKLRLVPWLLWLFVLGWAMLHSGLSERPESPHLVALPDIAFSALAGLALIWSLKRTYSANGFSLSWFRLFAFTQVILLVSQVFRLWQGVELVDLVTRATFVVSLFVWIVAIASACLSWSQHKVRAFQHGFDGFQRVARDWMDSMALGDAERERWEKDLLNLSKILGMEDGTRPQPPLLDSSMDQLHEHSAFLHAARRLMLPAISSRFSEIRRLLPWGFLLKGLEGSTTRLSVGSAWIDKVFSDSARRNAFEAKLSKMVQEKKARRAFLVCTKAGDFYVDDTLEGALVDLHKDVRGGVPYQFVQLTLSEGNGRSAS